MNYIKLNDIFVRRFTFRNIGVSLDIENYCTVSLFFEPRQPGGCKLKTAPVRPVVAARPAEYVCSEDLFY